ncbi:hypothetical protein CJF31_00002522 [Rutstroemia sp. NJR-2017a BVV2]|nr:hypothetical protein CJF31_00002522 [Rutstroemia sp. NJR-2017a BVV2]
MLLASGITSVLSDASISTFANSLTLSASFDPIKPAYWTGLPHHRRTPFSVSPDGKSAYLAYLDTSYAKVYVQQVSVDDFTAVGDAVSVTAYEAAGLVAQNDGFALMATINATSTTDANNAPIVAIIRYTNGTETWRTPLNGPGVHASDGLTCSPDANGDLVYSATAGLYAGYFVVEAYSGDASGHYGDSIQYVDDTGALKTISGASSTFGCSHNTGIGLEAADAAPFASVCAEDQGDIWLNTETQYMSGVKIANENTTNGCSGEPMGGMSGSYSNLALLPSTTTYIFAWQSRGAVDLTLNDWMGSPYTQCSPRWLNHNVAITVMSDKSTLAGKEASSVVGAAEGDTQVNWITYSSTEDHQNVHVAAINSNYSLVTWETLTDPDCQPTPLGCTGTYNGTSFQIVDSAGSKVGNPVVSSAAFVSGDIANVGTDKVCWPYVDMTWDLSAPKSSGAPVTKMSFACASLAGSASGSSSTSASSVVSATSAAASVSSVAAVVSATSSSVQVASSVAGVEVSSSSAVAHTQAASSAIPSSAEVPVASSSIDAVASSSILGASASPTSTQAFSPTFVRPSHTATSTATATGYEDDDVCEWA